MAASPSGVAGDPGVTGSAAGAGVAVAAAVAGRRLREAVQECDSGLFALFARHAEALAARGADELAAVGEELAALGYAGLVLEALEAARALSSGRSSDELARRARELSEISRLSPGPAWPAGTLGAGELTARERQICELAASG